VNRGKALAPLAGLGETKFSLHVAALFTGTASRLMRFLELECHCQCALRRRIMDATTLLVIILIVLVLGGGGWYGRGRWY
jgi:hypothetical protein